ncbi:LysM peptidoglycan-binding domain-containing protein [Enterococcus faecium]|uniref:LysM peptidoglycan-binding domain-containing protein n=1 Tax=Enterococcus faecium TaxID=1352 RepID=UPI0020915BE7|nr:LysM peptidoglycan-binding domain-containing protein [Enterococcus faecium]MCO5533298.1 LysM peptidoglycan-binding domain-containing protein [Enterococcus faecium]
MDDLVKWNKIKNYTIHPGQVLTIQTIVSIPAKPAITTTPKAESKSGVTIIPKVDEKPSITITPKVKSQSSGVTTIPKIDKIFSIEKTNLENTNPLIGIKYSDKVKSQMKTGDYHSFPLEVDNYGGTEK